MDTSKGMPAIIPQYSFKGDLISRCTLVEFPYYPCLNTITGIFATFLQVQNRRF